MAGKEHSRFDTQNVAHAPCLVAVLLVCLSNGIDVVDAINPLFLLQLNLTDEIVHMANQRAENLPVAREGLGAH